MQIPH